MTRRDSLLGVILAGGKSGRMGRDKATLQHQTGKTFLDFAIDRMRSVTPTIAVSGRESSDAAVVSIPDRWPDKGPAAAVYSAVCFGASAGFQAIVVTPVDMPELKSDDLRLMISKANAVDPTCAVFGAMMPHPLVAIYPTQLVHELEQVACSPRRSLREWLASRQFTAVSLPESSLNNVNTPDQLS